MNTSLASSNETLCFLRLSFAFRAFHSNSTTKAQITPDLKSNLENLGLLNGGTTRTQI